MTELVGQQVGQYQVLEQIGTGGMATVYRAWQTSMKRDVAIKVLRTNTTRNEEFLRRFYHEVEIIASLQHPHILPVYDFGEHDGMPYVVMAYLTGGTLADYMVHHGSLNLTDVNRLVKQIADALDYAHKKGIIHRDFKPSNVLLDEQGNTYLADFGLARVSEAPANITAVGSVVGTPAYMAPEQAQSENLTSAVDVYALGVTIFQMLTGRVPYEAPTLMGVLLAHITQPIPQVRNFQPNLPHEAQVVISTAMAKAVEERYPTPGSLAAALSQVMEGGPKQAQDPITESPDALLMTNLHGQVIFLDENCLHLLGRHHSDARLIIGKPLYEVLSISNKVIDKLISDLSKNAQVTIPRLEVKDAQGSTIAVGVSAIATYDAKKKFVGADITLQPTIEIKRGDLQTGFVESDEYLNTTEESFLQKYFNIQLAGIQELLIQMGGAKLGSNLQTILNETAARNSWPFKMDDNQFGIDVRSANADIYRALLAKAVAYADTVVGERVIRKHIQAVEAKIDAQTLKVADVLRLR
ncbi:MAG: protein kinase [Anaerolineae bacterium]|nr:protein kinase [Anaerolineae bacterium]